MQTTQLKLRFIEGIKGGFESNPGLTPQFLKFCNAFRRDFKAYLEKEFKATNIDIHRGHFEVSGFFTQPLPHCVNTTPEQEKRVWYFDTGDVRWSARQLGMLVRTAKDYKDYTGGRNQTASFESYERFNADMHEILKIHEEGDGCEVEKKMGSVEEFYAGR